MTKEKITLIDGTVCYGDRFDMDDYKKLQEIFSEWKKINNMLKPLGGRNLNVPDVFSEALYCIFFNAVRTNGQAYSYDCVSLDNHKGIQIKSGSIKYDCTSFGPKSTWDELIYVDFAPNGSVDGKVNFYKIDIDFSKLILNEAKGETFHDQQLQGRRPRFSLKRQVIEANNIQPILSIDLLDEKSTEKVHA